MATQQYLLLQRNLVYTGMTRGRKLVVLIDQPKALAVGVKKDRTDNRFSGLQSDLEWRPFCRWIEAPPGIVVPIGPLAEMLKV